MQLSTSFILVAAMLTSAFHMVAVSALPHSTTGLSHHPIPSGNHHSLERRMEMELEYEPDYWEGLTQIAKQPWQEQDVSRAYKTLRTNTQFRTYGELMATIEEDPKKVSQELKEASKVWENAKNSAMAFEEQGWRTIEMHNGMLQWVFQG
ncbi:hypothetical protein BC835DRAFT_1351237 [Cytidiella melzeri]|nr:hypothetical protein BC835DRAFT_1351237 [Cytidiella melzeri]